MAELEDTAFQPEEVEPLLNDVVAKVLANEVYDEAKVATWVDRICDQSMQKLTQMNKPFKYVVTCILMQKNGAACTQAEHVLDAANYAPVRIAYPPGVEEAARLRPAGIYRGAPASGCPCGENAVPAPQLHGVEDRGGGVG